MIQTRTATTAATTAATTTTLSAAGLTLAVLTLCALCAVAYAPSAQAHDNFPLVRQEANTFTFFNHGFRLGYMTLMNHDCAITTHEPSSCQNIQEERGLVTPHTMFIGYELTQRLRGSDWMNVIFVENILVAGLEQSTLLPSFNMLLGFEFVSQFQFMVGANLVPSADKTAHMVVAGGWVPQVGEFQVPVHFFFIPDVDAQHRLGISMGVNW
jgi:hypothetical protein